MTSPTRVAVHWSGGKDSALALMRLLAHERYEPVCLVTTMLASTHTSTVHDLPRHLLQAQADAIGVPLHMLELHDPGLADYAAAMTTQASRWRAAGIEAVAFGDLGPAGAAPHRRALFEPLGLEVIEPLSDLTSATCMESFAAAKMGALTIVVDAAALGPEHLGVAVDRRFVASLPPECDPAGESGEYHSFVFDTPYFAQPVTFAAGQAEYVVRRIGTRAGPQDFAYWQLPLT